MIISDSVIAVIGLGYVGLPLAVEFGKKRPTIGFDINPERIKQLSLGVDQTLEVEENELLNSGNLSFSSDVEVIRSAQIYVIAVPTPIDSHKKPDLKPLIGASKMVGRLLKKEDIVIFESTVFPGATEEVCVPILEEESGLSFNIDFFCGYSPERINPGDKERSLTSITKVTSGSTPEAAQAIDKLYKSIIDAGTHLADSIRVAEAAKVIENTQRDLNIALVNELAIIFNKLKIDTDAVLTAAQTKWNFLPFRPGLVGGHCIGVDPYYLTYKAESIGYYPQLILAGRRINEGMSSHIVNQIVKVMIKSDVTVNRSRALVLGLTFKENCPDLRNSRVFDLISELKEYGMQTDVYDPWVVSGDLDNLYGLECVDAPKTGIYDVVILAVAHSCFVEMGAGQIRKFGRNDHIFFDLKSVFEKNESSLRL